jgi:hypothetical protein
LDSAFKGDTKLDTRQFDNLMGWIEKYNPDSRGLDQTLGQTTVTLREFIAAVKETEKAGQVDLKAAAESLGIGFEDMAGAIEGGIEDVAK